MHLPITLTPHGVFIEVDGRRLARLTWRRESPTRVVAEHTVVDTELRGHGVARRLLDATADWARLTGTTVHATCAYVREQYAKDPTLADLREEREERAPRLLSGHAKDLGGFSVTRVLPAVEPRFVGPVVFLDHMGPADLPPGPGIDVRPHPHIGLATVTALFSGAIHHRDSLGSDVVITPGAVNWMTAGRGIVHSERTPAAALANGQHIHGLQLWVALPTEKAEDEPAFQHVPADAVPVLVAEGVEARVLAGTGWGHTSPVRVASPMVFATATVAAGARIAAPKEGPERAIYVASGRVRIGEQEIGPSTLAVLSPDAAGRVEALTDARLGFIGGEGLGPRVLWWNFVAADAARIRGAAEDWAAGRFPKVPGDELEFTPLPEGRAIPG